MSCMLTA